VEQLLFLCNQRFTRACGEAPKCTLSICWPAELTLQNRLHEGVNRRRSLEGDHPMNAVCTEDTELAFVIAAKVNQAAATLAGAS
jgi:hypothetical protein